MPNRAFQFEFKQVADEGTFTGVASTYGDPPDLGNDIISPNAFVKTLQTSGPTRPLLWQHSSPIGVIDLQDTGAALAAKGKLSMGVQLAREAHQLLRDGAVRGLSIGFQADKEHYTGDVRYIDEAKLWEVSLTPFPMNESAMVTDVKSGRTISAATRQRLGTAASHMKSASDILTELCGEADDGDGDEAGDKAARQQELIRAIREIRKEVKRL